MPRPTSVDAGSVVVSVTLTVPVADALKTRNALPPGAICPMNVSVPAVSVGAAGVVDDELSLLLQAAASAETIATSSDRLIRVLKEPLCESDVTQLKDCRMKCMRATTALLGILLLGSACSHNSTTSPSASSTTTTTTVASPTVSETFSGTLPVGGFKFYSFTIAANGTVNVTLNSVAGIGVPSTVQVGLGIGQPAGIDCAATVTATAGANFAKPQATGTFGPGAFCVRVFDVGNLAAPASFNITIAHP
jgi:hypothetical protein